MSYSDLIAVRGKTFSDPSYVEFYFKKERIREYNGESLALLIEPNSARSPEEKERLLIKLEYELHKALDTGSYPASPLNKLRQLSTAELLDIGLKLILDNPISIHHKRNMIYIHSHFKRFLTNEELSNSITLLTSVKVQEFLQRRKCADGTYMSRRRALRILLKSIGRHLDITLDIVDRTDKIKITKRLNPTYEPAQLKPIFSYLKANHPSIHLCTLMIYGCFLRPNQEIRRLCGRHFKNDCTEIHLSGSENKGRKVRVVNIPDYLRDELLAKVAKLKPHEPLFKKANGTAYSANSFMNRWARVKPELISLGLINEGQAMYTFRHTAAVHVYKKTKDPFLVQKFMGHSFLGTTIHYLTALGFVYRNEDLKANMPTLEG